jgi:tetrapyrrole methylase family protein/MazG family protein
MSFAQDIANLSPIDKLTKVMAHLRSGTGCPWDREQTHLSLKKYLLEETYEVIQAIDDDNMYNLREELGDLLLQVVFHAQIAAEEGEFTLEDIIENLVEKLLRRHPHVFADTTLQTSQDVNKVWEKVKFQEKLQLQEKVQLQETEREYLQTPKGLPALMYAEATQRKASQWGFDWLDSDGPWAKVFEELRELEQAVKDGSPQSWSDEMGDILFSLVNLSRFIDVDPEDSLRRSTTKFRKRFADMMKNIKETGKEIEKMSLEEMDEVWNQIKHKK